MTKELYDRLLKYRTPCPLSPDELPLADAGYICLVNSAVEPMEYEITDKARLEMSDFEKAEDRQRDIDQREEKRRRKNDQQNLMILIVAVLTLIATIVGILISLFR